MLRPCELSTNSSLRQKRRGQSDVETCEGEKRVHVCVWGGVCANSRCGFSPLCSGMKYIYFAHGMHAAHAPVGQQKETRERRQQLHLHMLKHYRYMKKNGSMCENLSDFTRIPFFRTCFPELCRHFENINLRYCVHLVHYR